MLMDIDPAGAGQGWLDLFAEEEASPELMQAMDRINAKYGRGGYGLRRAGRGSGTNRGKCVKSCAHRTTPHVSQTSPSHAPDEHGFAPAANTLQGSSFRIAAQDQDSPREQE